MPAYLRKGIESVKQSYIQRLINAGIYKKDDRQLYELAFSELKNEYRIQIGKKKGGGGRAGTGKNK
ncbi:MAG TPA: Fur-regulated basic protein FbpA [Bacillales bacterium]|nr:Fur-regulated basic protein FbpA [Bacillales bacterium]